MCTRVVDKKNGIFVDIGIYILKGTKIIEYSDNIYKLK